ncbi:penicillin-binding protein activator [Porticoccus sp. W117]|uniref:penicillin-binding protein activator n=1 Tax=Porticoccus sp. W117 TaxID=3054777 RepID=UPI002594880B|nr:penicillin-binding protein activator [Porticoccus sp. W117]MDM3870934.1 penicillin-binding protein activator [Porticoccus sp. W117]
MRLRFTRAFCRTRLTVIALSSILASGCLSPKPSGPEYTTGQAQVQRANELLQRAAGANSTQRQALLLDAAHLLYNAENYSGATRVLQQVEQDRLTLHPLARYSLLSAELALQEDNFFVARHHLTHPALERMWRDLPVELRQRWHRHRATVFAILGEEQRSIKEYVALSSSIDDGDEISKIHQQLWQLLTRIPQLDLQKLVNSEKQQVLKGWYQLAQISRSNQGNIEGLQQAIDRWQNNWAWHPGALYPPAGLDDIRAIANRLPRQLALLLPMSSGKLANAGQTIRDGFMAAYYQVLEQGHQPPVIQLYDTAADPDIEAVYRQAVNDGAEMVIGPLARESVDQLNAIGDLPVPTVSLTYLQDAEVPVANQLLQFGLSAPNEARQVADRAWLEGHRRALAIVPDSALGQRTLAAFQQQWESHGGELVQILNYQRGQVDFKAAVKKALLIDQSQQRSNRLANVLGKRLKSEPLHRRNDLDMVFLFSFPEEGRQVKPMLDFFHADDLPVYATSQIYDGKPQASKDRDLDGVRFAAMPWALPGTIAESMIPKANFVANFFALGLDAYKIHQAALQMQLLPETQLFGSTGSLSLDNNQVIRRQPWAEFRGGKVRRARLPDQTQ